MEEHHEISSKKLNLLNVAGFFWNSFPFFKKKKVLAVVQPLFPSTAILNIINYLGLVG